MPKMQITVWEVSGTFKVQGNKIPKQMQYNMQYNMQNTEIVCMLDNMQYMQNNMLKYIYQYINAYAEYAYYVLETSMRNI